MGNSIREMVRSAVQESWRRYLDGEPKEPEAYAGFLVSKGITGMRYSPDDGSRCSFTIDFGKEYRISLPVGGGRMRDRAQDLAIQLSRKLPKGSYELHLGKGLSTKHRSERLGAILDE